MKELRTSVKLLEDKIVADHDEEIKGIRKKQDMIDSILVENTEAIKRIDSEIQKYQLEKKEDSEADSIRGTEIKSHKRCRYFNRGHCRNKVSVDLHTQAKVVQNILRRANVRGNPVHIDIQKFVNG